MKVVCAAIAAGHRRSHPGRVIARKLYAFRFGIGHPVALKGSKESVVVEESVDLNCWVLTAFL